MRPKFFVKDSAIIAPSEIKFALFNLGCGGGAGAGGPISNIVGGIGRQGFNGGMFAL